MLDFLRDNWFIILLLLIILALLRDALRQRGGIARVWRAIVVRFRRRFERDYLDLLLDTQSETPALLVKGDLTSLELVKAFASMRVRIEGAPESDAEPIEPERGEHAYPGRQAWHRRLWQRWRARDEPSRPPNTPGGAIWRHRRLVIRGKPGSGKTTLLKHIAITCARELRPRGARRPESPDSIASAREVYGWPRALFPIFIPLRRLARLPGLGKHGAARRL